VTLVVVSGCLVVLVGFGVRASFGRFLAPMSESFLWGREVFAMAIALQNLMWGISQPFAGPLQTGTVPAVSLSLAVCCSGYASR
jgi:hypothetical protein